MAEISISDVRTMVASGELEVAIKALWDNFADKEFKDYITTVSGRYNALNDKIIHGILSSQEMSIEENKIMVSLLKIINNIEEVEQSEKRLNNVNQKLDNRSLVQKLLEILAEAHKGFIAQAEIRNRVHDAVRERLSVKNRLQYEDFFNQYYSEMNEAELALHETIREYTEKILNTYNRKALELIIGNKDLLQLMPRLKELERHLLVWLGKYEQLFHSTPSQSLIYVGVKENVPFPTGIETELKHYLETE